MLKTLLRKVNAESGGARVQWRALRRSAHEGQSVCATLATFGSREGYLEWLQPFLLLNSCRSLPSAVGINSSGWILPFMVCETCEKKLAKVICPDKWKDVVVSTKSTLQDGARNVTDTGGRKVNENKLLGKKGSRYSPYAASKCKICKQNVHQQGGMYCQTCAYSKGVCSLCGKVILDTKGYKQSHA